MRNCELLILGGGHVAMGLAVAQPDSLICEESEFLDAGFSLTLKGFTRNKYRPLSAPSVALQALYEDMGLLSEAKFHCGALEVGASRFALEQNISVLLKSRMVKLEKMPEGYAATFITNAGLETVHARNVVDVCPGKTAGSLSALFTLLDEESFNRVAKCFPDGKVEPSFCPQWGALHMPVAPEMDYNRAIRQLYGSWKLEEKLALIAPRLTYLPASMQTPSDSAFDDPLAAFEAGYRWGKEAF